MPDEVETEEQKTADPTAELLAKFADFAARYERGEQERAKQAERLSALESQQAQEQLERSSQRIKDMLDVGETAEAREEAIKIVKQKANRLGIDVDKHPKLAEIRELEDANEILKSYTIVEPFLVEERSTATVKEASPPPAPERTPILLQDVPEEVKRQLEQEILKKYGLLRTVTASPTGGMEIESLSPREKIKLGMQQDRES